MLTTNVNESVSGKNLLVLGGGPMWVDIVQASKDLGVRTVVVDWHSDRDLSPAKLLSDASYDVSIEDTEALLEIVRAESVDGVLTGYTDIVLDPYRRICAEAGLHCYGTREQFDVLSDKQKFKALCSEFGIPTVKGFYCSTESTLDVNSCQFPVVIKPADSSGTRGIRVAANEVEFSAALTNAATFSKSKKFVVERYMGGKSQLTANYTISAGEITLSALYDRFMNYEQKGFASLPMCQYYPSDMLAPYKRDVDLRVKAMLSSLGVQNGFFSLQGFWDDEGFYFYDPGFRLGGGQSYNFTELVNGTNTLKRMIRFAVSGKMLHGDDSLAKDDPEFPLTCGTVFLNVKPGVIGRIEGLDGLAHEFPEVIHVLQQLNVGDEVALTGSLKQTVARIQVVAPTRLDFARVVRALIERIQVLNADGCSMLMKTIGFDDSGRPIDFVGLA